jgi:hypothetical protein
MEPQMSHDDRRLEFQNRILNGAIGVLTDHSQFLVSRSADLDPEFLSIFRTENRDAVGPLIEHTVKWLQAARQRSDINPEAVTIATYMVAMCYRLAERLVRNDISSSIRANYGSSHVDWCLSNFDRTRLSQLCVEGNS